MVRLRVDSCPARESALEDRAAPPLSPASLRTGCADRKRVRPLVGRNWRQGSLEETKPAWKTTQLLGRAFGPAVNRWAPRLANWC